MPSICMADRMIMKILLLLLPSMLAVAREADRTGRSMRPRTRRHGRNHQGLRPFRRQCCGTAGPLEESSGGHGAKPNAICSSLSGLAPSHTRTGRLRSVTARRYRSRSHRGLHDGAGRGRARSRRARAWAWVPGYQAAHPCPSWRGRSAPSRLSRHWPRLRRKHSETSHMTM